MMNFDTQNTARGGEEQLPPAKSADLDVGCRPDNVLGTEAQPAIRQLSASLSCPSLSEQIPLESLCGSIGITRSTI